MVDVQIYGMNPRGHHLTNVAIHTISTVLLLLLLFRLTGSLWQSSFVAVLFALHPLHVESVAWAAERKDVLCAFFWFLTLLCYVKFIDERKITLYLFTLLSFMIGLMCKPMLVTLPVIMLLLDYWPLNRYSIDEYNNCRYGLNAKAISIMQEKIPFFFCSVLSIIVTIYAQSKGGAIKNVDLMPIGFRIQNALIAYVKYISKTLWPHDLAVLYPIPSSFLLWQVIGSLFILILFSGAAFWAGRRYPYIAVGWFWFLITLIPVIGLIQVGNQSMADRYSYIPAIGLFIVVAWGSSDLTKGLLYRSGILALLAGAVVIASAALTWQQLGCWRDSISLYKHTLQVTTGNYLINTNLGAAYQSKGDLDAAIKEYQMALNAKPNFMDAHNNMGVAFAAKGDLNAAIKEYQVALRLSPNDLDAHTNLGNALAGEGMMDAALQEYQVAVRISPNNKDGHNHLGIALASKGDLDAAIQEFREALRISPNYKKAQSNLGIALTQKKVREQME